MHLLCMHSYSFTLQYLLAWGGMCDSHCCASTVLRTLCITSYSFEYLLPCVPRSATCNRPKVLARPFAYSPAILNGDWRHCFIAILQHCAC